MKVLAAIGLFIGLFKEKLVYPSALIMASLNLGAIFMHFKVSDEAIKFLPAGLMFVFRLSIIYLQKNISAK